MPSRFLRKVGLFMGWAYGTCIVWILPEAEEDVSASGACPLSGSKSLRNSLPIFAS